MIALLCSLAMAADPVTIDDVFTLDSARVRAVSQDGETALVSMGRWNETTDRMQWDLWSFDLKDGGRERLTFDRQSEGSVALAPDGAVWFLGSDDRGDDAPPTDGSRQVFRWSDGRAVPVTAVPDGVDHFELSRDGSALFVLRTVDHTWDDAFASLRKSHGDDITYGHGVQQVSVVDRIDTVTWRSETVYEADRVIYELAVSPDGARIALVTTPDEELVFLEGWSHIDILDVSSGEVTTLDDTLWRAEAPSPFGWLYGLAWSDEGQLAHRVDFDGHPGEAFITDVSAGTSRRVQRSPDLTWDGAPVFRPGTDELCLPAEKHARRHLLCVDEDGEATTWIGGESSAFSFAFGPRGRTVTTVVADAVSEGHIVTGRPGRLQEVASVNPHAADWAWPTVSEVSWTAPDGTEVHGVLETPPDWSEADGPLPLVVSIHGGPTSSTLFTRRAHLDGRGLLATQGYALLSPNYRGSTGFGDTFLVDLVGRECDIEVADILAGVDALVERGVADAEHMAVMGWSNGGYLTNCLITATDRFDAASSGAGVFDQVMQWATEDTPGHVVNYMEGLPWETPEAHVKASPLFRADRITTPTLIHVGEFDERVPAVHARALYRALFQYLDVPTELVVYDGEGHGLRSMAHRRAKLEWDAAWFEHWLADE